MDRQKVYKLIDGERDYQKKWSDVNEGRRTIDEFSGYILGYALELIHTTSHGRSPEHALATIRKIAALGVACMEQHGAPER